MNIKGLDYNTQREKMLLTEYGREIHKMVEHAMSLPDRDERLRCAKTIVKLMATKVTQSHDSGDLQQTLWDHLYLMSHGQLDIEWPYDVSQAEKIHAKPEPLKLPQQQIRLRHYGRLIEELFEKLKAMPEGKERDTLAQYTANQMKRDLTQWGHGTMDDEKVLSDLANFTDGIIQLNPETFVFERVTAETTPAPTKSSKKKKKK